MKKVLVHRVHPTGREVRIVEERIGAVTVWNVDTRYPDCHVRVMRGWHTSNEALWMPTLADAEERMAQQWAWWDRIEDTHRTTSARPDKRGTP